MDIETDAAEVAPGNPQVDEAERKLVVRVRERIKQDQKHFEKAFERMRRDMEIARRGATKEDWSEDQYTANITGRHIRQTVAGLYAKNPKASARRRARLDFQIWDENEQTLLAAFQTVQQFQAVMAAPLGGNVLPGPGAPMMGHNGGPAMGLPMMVPPEVQQAQAVIADFQAGMQERQMAEKTGKTLEVLFNYYMEEQKPVTFKSAMKQTVRRTCTCAVAYAKLGFQRAYDVDDMVTSQIADVRAQVAHLKVLQAEVADPDDQSDNEAKQRELELSLESLQQQEYLLLREGLVFDFPESTRVIPDRRTRNLTGFVGARWITLLYFYTADEVRGLFGIDLGTAYKPYNMKGESLGGEEQRAFTFSRDDVAQRDAELVCVFEHYDRQAGLVYTLADGYPGFLKRPAPPDVYVEDFWPVYALTFNEGEDPEQIVPPSDVALLYDMQKEYNRSRQGKREHRQAARPRFVTPRGAFDEEATERLRNMRPFDVVEVNQMGDSPDVAKLLQPIPMPGVDPNLYDTNEIVADMGLVVGASPTNAGSSPNDTTATGEALAEDSRSLSASSNVDDLDQFLSTLARAAGQILLREMSAETVRKLAGRGAVWPEMSLEDIASEVYLEVEAGSTGKPNAAAEIRNWREMLPFLLQMPGIQPTFLARESLRRLDDRMDITDAIADGLPAIVAMNRMSQVGPADPGAAPDQQGGEGGGNGAPQPGIPSGSVAPMGDNRV